MTPVIGLLFSLTLAQQPPAAPPQIPEDVQAEMDVEYSRVGERVAMDIFRPKTPGPHPAILAIHGGGFRAGSRTGYIPLCIRAAQKGYVCATASYRLSPRNQFPAHLEDAKAAVRFLRANAAKYAIDPAYIGATGGSAGGHLVLMLGLTPNNESFEGTGPNRDMSSAVQAVVNYFGPTDFTRSYEPGKSVDAAQVLPLFLGGDLEHNRQQHILSSPLYYVTPQASPILSIHGTKDRYVAYEQSVWLTEKLKAAGVETELVTIKDSDHGFKGADAEYAERRLFEFFDKHLKPAAQQKILISDHGPAGQIVAMLWPSGRELWTLPNDRGHDVQSLSNGGVLFTVGAQKKIVETDAAGKTVWTCCDGLEHPLAAQRLDNGNTLIGDAKAGRVIEVDKAGKVQWSYAGPDIANMRMRNVHRTKQGTTFIAVEADAKLIEVNREGTIVWQWQAPEGPKRRLYMGRRLDNGNTVMSLSDPGEIVEVDPSGKVVRSIAGKSLDIQFGWASGFTQLPNGNLLISDYTGRRLVEVDAKGAVVNQLRLGHRTVASLTAVR
jgi:acetyl esterase/lipase